VQETERHELMAMPRVAAPWNARWPSHSAKTPYECGRLPIEPELSMIEPGRAGAGPTLNAECAANAIEATGGWARSHCGAIVRLVRKLRSTACRGSVMIESIIIWLIIGGVAGWLAGLIVKGYGFGLVGNIVVGIIGAVIAGWLLPMIGVIIGGGIIAAIIDAVIGAVILLVIIGFFKRAA